MAHTVKDIAAALGAEAFGAVDLLVHGASEPASATATDLALRVTGPHITKYHSWALYK